MPTAPMILASLASPPPASPPPIWHLPARCEEGDVNGLFQWGGRWHLMQQWHARPATSIGHSVSTDLLRFARVADALRSGPAEDQQCYDGSSSITALGPMLMIDGGCGLFNASTGETPCMESRGQDSGGVTASPANLSDVNLTVWKKRGPTRFEDCGGAAGPSPIWRSQASGKHLMVAIAGDHAGDALFEATDETLTSWRRTQPALTPGRGGGGQLWHPLPRTKEGAPPHDPAYTHILQVNRAGGGDGAPSFVLLRFDEAASTTTNLTAPTLLDSGSVRFGTLSNVGGTAAQADAPGDTRTIHVSWLTGATDGTKSCGASNIHSGQLTSLRDLRYDPRLGPHGMLVEAPIEEYLTLRTAAVAQQNTTVTPTTMRRRGVEDQDQAEAQSLLSFAAGAFALDIELAVAMATPGSLTVGVACGWNDSFQWVCGAQFELQLLNASAVALNGVQYPLLPAEEGEPVPLRIMLDTRSVEAFAHDGRAAWSDGVSWASCSAGDCDVSVLAATQAANVSAIAFGLKSIWSGSAHIV
tara:strand:- start:369 stop:1952 length:1584 start_codon:yes stop_codon:yes gene_type:complete